MKRTNALLLVFIIFTVAFAGCAQPASDEEQLAGKLLASLQHAELDDFIELCLSKDDYRQITIQMRKVPGLDNASEDALVRSWEEYQLLVTEMFRSIIDEGVQQGVRWAHIEMLSVVPGDEVIEDYIPPAIKMLNDLSIRFSDGKGAYLIRFYDPVRIHDTWKISSHLYLLHKEG